jgi:hypothetical protein
MTLASKIAIGAATAVLIGAGVAVAFGGVLPRSSDAHPPCEDLPTAAEAAAALAENQALANDIEALGQDISVRVGSPCPHEQDHALIIVTYGSEAEREAIGRLLERREGFGVPVHLVRQ